MTQISMNRSLHAGLAAISLAALPCAATAQVAAFDPQEGLNVVALGIGSAPDYMGSADGKAALAPTARYYFSGRRYAQLLGTQLSVNVLDDGIWQFGPQVVVRLKRDDDVDDEVVKRMTPIDSEAEFGAFAAAVWQLNDDPRHRIGVRADLQGGDNGTQGTLTFNYYHPVSPAVVLNVGGGIGAANGKWARTYFGVRGSNIALYPSLGGSAYEPEGGLMDNRLNFSAIVNLSPQWLLMAGARYQRLHGDISDSPVVAERGDRNQWIYGLVLGYAWQ